MEFLDARLQHYLRKVIMDLPYPQREQLRNLAFCNTRSIHQNESPGYVYLMRNDEESKFFGTVTCKNTWACPHCSAVQMSKYRKKIGALIDALDDKNIDGFMVTFTIPHLQFQFCREVTDILYNTWKQTFRNAFTNRGKKGFCNAYNKFFVQNDISHFVRCAEYTWGKNGWHPHFHVLFFTPRKNMDKILQYEESLREKWADNFFKVAKKYFEQNNILDENHQHILDYFSEHFNDNKWVHISTDPENPSRPLKVTSAAYVAGWTSDQELTGNVRKEASHENHFTPYQILEKAFSGDKKFEQLYIDFMLGVTRKPVHHRVNFSKKGTLAIAIQKLNQAGYQEVLKKKSQTSVWENVCWFTSEEWQLLSYADIHEPVLENILYLAHIRRDDLLREYLKFYNVKFRVEKIPIVQHVEKIFNYAA